MEPTSTLLVSKLPKDIYESKIREIFSEFGAIRRCYVTPSYEEKKLRLAYVTFKNIEDAIRAQSTLSVSSREGIKFLVKFSKPKIQADVSEKKTYQKPFASNDFNKKARLIVRNISFNATEEDLKSVFNAYGDLLEIRLLKKPDGSLVGCAFIQFRRVPEASNALKHCNGNLIHNRNIVVDWAVPKSQYQTTSVKAEENISIKEENCDTEDQNYNSLTNNDESDFQCSNVKVKQEKLDSDSMDESEDEDAKEVASDCESNLSEHEDEEESSSTNMKKPIARPVVSKDIKEMKTVFVRNLPFDASEEELTELMSNFGPVKYSLLCFDKVTEHPKGTAFVQFLNKDSVDKCLADSADGLQLNGRTIQVFRALSRADVPVTKSDKIKHDRRNLYLAKEGQLLPSNPAIEGVSSGDLQKRATLDLRKKKMLQNLTMFVSDKRLCVHNIPPSLTDKELRKLFLKHSPRGSKITEARVMRDRKKLKADGLGQSKEYGFISYRLHEDALAALRNINNNPNIFSPEKRPIVEFSIENKAALLAKQKRAEKSKAMNPNANKKENSLKVKQPPKNISVKKNNAEFTGFQSDSQKKVPLSLKIRTKPRHSDVKKDKLNRKQPKKNPQKRKPIVNELAETSEPSAKKKKKLKGQKSNEDSFSNLVESYKKKLMSVYDDGRKKWFDE